VDEGQEERPEWLEQLHEASDRLHVCRVHSPSGSVDELPINRLRNYAIDRVLDKTSSDRRPVCSVRSRRAATECDWFVIPYPQVETSHMLYVDADFIPSEDAYSMILEVLKADPDKVGDPKAAFVVPAFAVSGGCKQMYQCKRNFASRVPKDFQELTKALQEKTVTSFGFISELHGDTDYDAWYEQEVPQIRALECLRTLRYEPYIVVKKTADLPHFDERFTGYGKNKVQWLVHLRFQGWVFFVLPRVFVAHMPHPVSAARVNWKMKMERKMNHLFDDFLHEMYQKAVSENLPPARIPMCPSEQTAEAREGQAEERIFDDAKSTA